MLVISLGLYLSLARTLALSLSNTDTQTVYGIICIIYLTSVKMNEVSLDSLLFNLSLSLTLAG